MTDTVVGVYRATAPPAGPVRVGLWVSLPAAECKDPCLPAMAAALGLDPADPLPVGSIVYAVRGRAENGVNWDWGWRPANYKVPARLAPGTPGWDAFAGTDRPAGVYLHRLDPPGPGGWYGLRLGNVRPLPPPVYAALLSAELAAHRARGV